VSQFQIPVFPNVGVEQYGSPGGQSYLDNGNDTHSVLVSLTKNAGRHNFRWGADMRLKRIHFFNLGSGSGAYTFNRVFTRGPNPKAFSQSGNAIASMLLGTTAAGNVPVTVGTSMQNYYHGFYLQDDIRLTTKLTMNLGLRYETESPYTERRNQMNWFDVDLAPPARNPAYPNLNGGLRIAAEDGRYVYDWDKNNLAPRVGFGYTADNRTVFRWGLGSFTRRSRSGTAPWDSRRPMVTARPRRCWRHWTTG
jgi:hypothetical protein